MTSRKNKKTAEFHKELIAAGVVQTLKAIDLRNVDFAVYDSKVEGFDYTTDVAKIGRDKHEKELIANAIASKINTDGWKHSIFESVEAYGMFVHFRLKRQEPKIKLVYSAS